MKRYFIILFLSTSAFSALAQSLNRKLFEAINNSDTLRVESLLNDGADANYKEKVGTFGMSMLILAVNKMDIKSVQLLTLHKVNIDERDWFNSTALMYAAHSGELAIINFLIKSGADIHADDGHGNTVLSAAKEGKHQAAIDLITNVLK